MIEQLSGLHETVNYRQNTQMRLYNNTEAEDYPPHWHTPYELIMPTSGTYRVVCGQNEYKLNTNDILIICPGIVHELFAPPEGERIIFQPNLSNLAIREIDLISSMITPALLISPETHPDICDKIVELMLEIKDEYFTGEAYLEAAVYSRFLQIMVLVGRDLSTQAQQGIDATAGKQKEYMERVILVCNYINTHFQEELTLEEAASMAGFSKYHFSRLFRQITSTSFYRYVSQKRIAAAKEYLISGKYSIFEVAYLSGFSSHSTFTRMFRQITGSTPNEFKKVYDQWQAQVKPEETS